MRLQRFERVHRIALALGHLLSVSVKDQSQDNNILIRGLVEQDRRLCHQGVEPSSCLVHCLGNESGRELLLESLFVLKRIVMLRKRHRSGVKPAVDDLRDSLHAVFAAFRTGAYILVDIRPVQFYGQSVFSAGHLLQFFAGTDADLLSAVLTLPDRKRSSPVAVAADTPVLYIFQPVAETA